MVFLGELVVWFRDVLFGVDNYDLFIEWCYIEFFVDLFVKIKRFCKNNCGFLKYVIWIVKMDEVFFFEEFWIVIKFYKFI